MTDARPAATCGRYTTSVLLDPEQIARVAAACAHCRRHQRRPQANLGPDLAPPAEPDTRVVLLYDRGEIAGFASVKVGTRRYPWRLAAAGRSFVPARFALKSAEYTDNDLIAPDDEEARAALLRALLDACADCSVLRLQFVAEDSDLWRMLTASKPQRDRRWIVTAWYPTPRWLVRTTGTFDEYIAKFGRNSRHDLRRRVRVLSEACGGDLRMEVITDRARLPAFLDRALAISRVSLRAAVTESRVAAERASGRLERLADRGQLLCYELVCAGKPAAFTLGWTVEGIYYPAICAFDPAWQKYAPGTRLFYLAIEDIVRAQRARWIDFGYGHLDYKQYFATDGFSELCAYLVRPGLRTAVAFGPVILGRAIRATLPGRGGSDQTAATSALRHGLHSDTAPALADRRTDRSRDLRG